MFAIDVPVVDYPDPWAESFADRLSRLGQSSHNVAYFYPRPDSSTFRYRVLNMIEALATTSGFIAASWFSAAELSYLEEILERTDVVVICRSGYSVEFARLVARVRALGKRVLYDIDDLVFDAQYVPVLLNTLDQAMGEAELDFWHAYCGRNGALMRLCDGVILTNAYLGERVQQFCDLPIAIIPNFMNGAQLVHSAKILDNKRTSGFARDGRIHVGYFSGSPTHRRDFAIIEDAIVDLMDSDPRIVLRVVGVLNLSDCFSRFGDRVEVFPFQNILNLQRLIGEVEINVVPLQNNVFTNCKSELKVFEASAVGTISVASPIFTLSRAIQDEETGFITPAHCWRTTLGRGIRQLKNYPEMANAAAGMALRNYVPEARRQDVVRALIGDAAADRG